MSLAPSLSSCDSTGQPRLTLLGTFELQAPGGDLLLLPLGTQRVLAFLALHERRHRRAFVAGTLWPNRSDGRANASLRSALYRLSEPAHHLVAASATQLMLSKTLLVDVDEMMMLSSNLEAFGPVDHASALVALFGRELLPDWCDDWLVESRESWRMARVRALEELAILHAAAGRFRLGLEAGLAAVRVDPLRESAQRALIGVHLAEGNLSEAV
jgi:DNA-binding SARP family transcriptional activator